MRVYSETASSRRRSSSSMAVEGGSGVLGCEWSYQPATHAAIGHHRLVTMRSEGIASIYIVCFHHLAHQAFAWQWRSEHSRRYPEGTRCGCGQRVKVLLPPRDETSSVLEVMSVLATRDKSAARQTAQLVNMLSEQFPALLLDDTSPIIDLWVRWGKLSDPVYRWLAQRILKSTPPKDAVAIADRGGQGGQGDAKGEAIALPRHPLPLDKEELNRLRSSRTEDKEAVPLIFPCGWAGAEELWVPQVMLKSCKTRLVCLSDLVREAANGKHELGANAFIEGRTAMVLQSQQMPIARALAAMYRVDTKTIALIHISNGNIWESELNQTVEMYSSWRKPVLRQYWLPDPHGVLTAARDNGIVDWFPIGMNPQWVRYMQKNAAAEVKMPLASARKHLLGFLGSTDKSDRSQRIALVDKALRKMRIIRVKDSSPSVTHLTVFHKKGNVACYGSECKDNDYIESTLDVALCLQLPGSSVESNRFYEGLEGGCIPIVVRRFGPGEEAVWTTPSYGKNASDAVKAALSPLDNVTGKPPPFIVVEREDELASVLGKLVSNNDGGKALDALQAENRAWWQQAKAFYAAKFAGIVC